MVKTDGMVLELLEALKQAVYLGTYDFKKQVFKNLKVIEDYAYPITESKKEIDKSIENYRNSLMGLTQEYSKEGIDGSLMLQMYETLPDGKPDKNTIRAEYLEFEERYNQLVATNKGLVKDYNKSLSEYKTSLSKPLTNDTLEMFKNKLVKITAPIPTKDNGDDAINSYILMEFDLIPLDEPKEAVKPKVIKKDRATKK